MTFDIGLSTMLFLLLGRHSQFSIFFLMTIRLHDSTHLPIIHDGVYFPQDQNISILEVPFSVCPFLPFLKRLKELFPPATPELIYFVLKPPPSFEAV